jgi:hypothetical protein
MLPALELYYVGDMVSAKLSHVIKRLAGRVFAPTLARAPVPC